MTKVQFLVQYPEFAEDSAPDDLIDVNLAAAHARTPVTVWGTFADQAAGLLTAHLISLSPWGQQARLAAADGSTTYSKERERMEVIAIGGCVL